MSAQSGVQVPAPAGDRVAAPQRWARRLGAASAWWLRLREVVAHLREVVTQLLASDRSVRITVGLAALSAIWFGVGPAGGQMIGIRAVVPALAGMTAVGQWRLGADRRLPAAAARFWLVLSIALLIFTAGMVVDFVVELGKLLNLTRFSPGEAVLYPIAGLLVIIALVVYPTAIRSTVDRAKIGLDIAIVLFGAATFVWHFVGARLWEPGLGFHELAPRLVLPSLSLLAGFAVLRITLAGANVICRRTMYCFVFAAATAAFSIFLVVRPESVSGRIGSMIQVLALGACVVGVAFQRAAEPVRPSADAPPPRPGWRRPFTVLPYVALAATISLLLDSTAPALDFQSWVVAAGVLALCAAVVLRQLIALWENSRLLSANQELTGELRHHAYHDQLTGLANRALFTERVAAAVAGTRPVGWNTGGEIAVLFVDLDDFKIVNDSLGHQVGDDLLVTVAERLTETVGSADQLCRLGGDEFAILLTDADADSAAAVAAAVVNAVGRPMRPAGIQVRVQASVGIALARSGEPSGVELLRNADVAMYTAKQAGKGGWQVFTPGMLTGLMARHGRRAALLRAVEHDQFEVHYQPIVDLASGAFVGAEALVRWRVDGELIAPDDFVPLAEEIGLIAEIDGSVLSRACRQTVVWRSGLGPDDEFTLHVNISARQLHRPELVGDVQRALRLSGLPAGRLVLEITEPGLTHDEDAVAQRLWALHRLGIRIAIDDFGAGTSSLSHLRTIPAGIVKIDKSFTDELADPTVSTPVAKGLIALASTLGIETIAEGVEHAEQVDRLRALGCARGQGFHLGRPSTAADFTDRLAGADREKFGGLVAFHN